MANVKRGRKKQNVSGYFRKIFQDEIDRFNVNLDRQEKIRRFALLARDFTIEADEITPSLKVKRKVIDTKYKSVIDEMYTGEVAEA